MRITRVRCTCGSHALPAWFGLGDLVEMVLHAFGLTERRYRAIKTWLGLLPECGCSRRKTRLNQLGPLFMKIKALRHIFSK